MQSFLSTNTREVILVLTRLNLSISMTLFPKMVCLTLGFLAQVLHGVIISKG